MREVEVGGGGEEMREKKTQRIAKRCRRISGDAKVLSKRGFFDPLPSRRKKDWAGIGDSKTISPERRT